VVDVYLALRSRNNSGSVLGALLTGLIAEGMQVNLNAPDIHVAAARTTDVISDDDFKCEGVFAPQSDDVVQPKRRGPRRPAPRGLSPNMCHDA
jgi:hypothetical protein